MEKQRRGREGYKIVADMASLLIHGVLKSIEIGGNPCRGGGPLSLLMLF